VYATTVRKMPTEVHDGQKVSIMSCVYIIIRAKSLNLSVEQFRGGLQVQEHI